MGVISMQMMRQYSGVGHSKPKPKPSTRELLQEIEELKQIIEDLKLGLRL